jgi:hypothetical protein
LLFCLSGSPAQARASLRRATSAAAAAPNRTIIGGAGTGVPPLDPPLEPPLELEVLALLAELVLALVLLDVLVLPPKLLDPLLEPLLDALLADEALLAELPELPLEPWPPVEELWPPVDEL